MHSLYISLFAYFIVSRIFVLLFVYRLNASSFQVPQARTCNPVLGGDELSASLRNSVIINVWNSNTVNNLRERLWSRNRCLEIMWWKVFKIELRKSSEGRPEYHRRQKRKCRGTRELIRKCVKIETRKGRFVEERWSDAEKIVLALEERRFPWASNEMRFAKFPGMSPQWWRRALWIR